MRRIVTAGILAAVFIAASLFAVQRWRDYYVPQKCDVAGDPCCSADSEVKTDHCHKGLGCNITSGQCEACGAPGQACCDGHFTGFSLRGYTGILLDESERIESCDAGARCDARFSEGQWVGSRTCQACGTQEGGSCCKPDVRYGLGRCFTDARSNTPLTCNDPWADSGGVCLPCGRTDGEIACMTARPCADGLIEKDGYCRACGFPGQPPCDYGEPCRDGQSVPNKSFTQCVPAGGAGQPCLANGGCSYQRMFCNSRKICEVCGEGGAVCCPPSEGRQCTVGECRNNVCFACGYAGMPECSTGDRCRDGSEPVGGTCRDCGDEGEPCCFSMSIRCSEGMSCKDRVCRRPPAPPPPPQTAKTCSGQPWTWSTLPRVVWLEGGDSCVVYTTLIASTPEEAVQCARNQHGEAVIGSEVESFSVAVNCPSTGCNQRTYPARDQQSAVDCAEATNPTCEVDAGVCP